MRRRNALLWLVLLLGCGSSPSDTGSSSMRTGGVRVLFIGNSLTYWNTLPAIVEALADSAGLAPLSWRMVAFPDYSLEDHWARPDAREAIAQGWDLVVLQQGPSSTSANRAHLIQWSKTISREIRKVSARPALYGVWPAVDRLQDLEASAVSYRTAADSVDGLYFPVSRAWRATWNRQASAPLYSGDGLHPSVAGSYLAALVMLHQIYDRSPVGLPARLELRLTSRPRLELDPALARVLQEAALEAGTQFGRR